MASVAAEMYSIELWRGDAPGGLAWYDVHHMIHKGNPQDASEVFKRTILNNLLFMGQVGLFCGENNCRIVLCGAENAMRIPNIEAAFHKYRCREDKGEVSIIDTGSLTPETSSRWADKNLTLVVLKR